MFFIHIILPPLFEKKRNNLWTLKTMEIVSLDKSIILLKGVDSYKNLNKTVSQKFQKVLKTEMWNGRIQAVFLLARRLILIVQTKLIYIVMFNDFLKLHNVP